MAMPLAASRKRYSGSVEPLVQIIKKFAITPNFLAYPEDLNARKCPAKLVTHGQLFSELFEVSDKLVFAQSKIEEACVRSHDDLAKTWGRSMTPEQLSSWSTAVGKQLRAACRHISQSMKTKWVQKLLQIAGPAEDEGEEADDMHEDAEEEDEEGEQTEEAHDECEDEAIAFLQSRPLAWGRYTFVFAGSHRVPTCPIRLQTFEFDSKSLGRFSGVVLGESCHH